jgi:hypothetical protein
LSRSWHCCRCGNDMWLWLRLAIGADELSSLFSSKSGANERLAWSTSESYPGTSIRRDKWCRSGGICLPHRVIGDVGSSYRSRVVHRRANVDALLKLCWRSDTNAFRCCSNDNMTWHSLLGNSIASCSNKRRPSCNQSRSCGRTHNPSCLNRLHGYHRFSNRSIAGQSWCTHTRCSRSSHANCVHGLPLWSNSPGCRVIMSSIMWSLDCLLDASNRTGD